ncbi:hypothetical protein [Nostoc sp. UHCC 0251]|uniref:hypothetical protein n=1 Tax=Nostoc sp. UHCC 0251 TaxID=3110240 RepID=UPI002B1FD611|nr:hypothetical protein [Nostoc sp. UHCC 0251]MEA5624115.1 hypothetical protein [Nostoc sp. UHCC 0251]
MKPIRCYVSVQKLRSHFLLVRDRFLLVKHCLGLRQYDFQNQFSHPLLSAGDYQR